MRWEWWRKEGFRLRREGRLSSAAVCKRKKKKKKGSNNSRTSHQESQWHDLATEGDYEVTHIAATEDSQKIPCRPCAVVSFLVPRSSCLIPIPEMSPSGHTSPEQLTNGY